MLNKREDRLDGVENRMSWDKREKKENEQPNKCEWYLLPPEAAAFAVITVGVVI